MTYAEFKKVADGFGFDVVSIEKDERTGLWTVGLLRNKKEEFTFVAPMKKRSRVKEFWGKAAEALEAQEGALA